MIFLLIFNNFLLFFFGLFRDGFEFSGTSFRCNMHQYSIGWSVGATLGYAQAVPEKRVLGDGSFQVKNNLSICKSVLYLAKTCIFHSSPRRFWAC